MKKSFVFTGLAVALVFAMVTAGIGFGSGSATTETAGCPCGDNCRCGDDCKCIKANCVCGDSCRCGDDCKCGSACGSAGSVDRARSCSTVDKNPAAVCGCVDCRCNPCTCS